MLLLLLSGPICSYDIRVWTETVRWNASPKLVGQGSACEARQAAARQAMPCALSDCGACGGIAHVVHQSWMTAQLPGELEPLSARWRRAGPSGWDHRLWTDDANRALWAAHFPELLPVYDGYPTAVQRADVTRLLYMHVHGGVYADLDVAPCDSAWAALEQQKQVCLPHPNSTLD